MHPRMNRTLYTPQVCAQVRLWTRLLALSLGSCLLASSALAQDFFWLEGEAASRQDVKKHPWWYDKVKKDVLSGGEWLHHFSDAGEGSAEWEFEVATPGSYVLWLRANPTAAKLLWSQDGGQEQEVDFANARGTQNIAEDNKPDLRFLAWARAGTLKCMPGKHSVKLRFASPASFHGGVDCLCITKVPFVPNGTQKPGTKAPAGPDVWFPLIADEMDPGAESILDMGKLLDAPAGKHGRLKAVGDRMEYAQKPGVPVKLWGVGANQEQDKYTEAQNQRRIAYLKRFGVNVVRQHTVFDEVSTDGQLDPKKLEKYDRWFAALKAAGIQTQWSLFYHFPISQKDGYAPELFAELAPMEGGKNGNRDSYGLITMSPELWQIRNKVMKQLLEHENSHTGLKYADDPALVAVELQNEDSIFFWNPLGELASDKPKKWPKHAQRLRAGFAAWAKAKYTDDAGLSKAWGDLKGESLAKGELGLMGPWELDTTGIRGKYAGQTKRAGDTLRYLAELQQKLYRMGISEIRAAGYEGMVITTNWLGGSGLTDQANIHTDILGDVIDRHNYAGGGAGGHGITEGQIYAESHLGKAGSHLFSIGLKQVEGKPFTVSEWTMCPPNQWKLEAAPILAFYGMGLQGWDGAFHFAQTGSRLGDGWPGMRSYATDTPHYMGQFPALAFALAKGHLKESPIIAARRVTDANLYSGTAGWHQDYYDGNAIKVSTAPGSTPLDVFAMGKVTVGIGEKPSEVADFTKYRNSETGSIESATGELQWNTQQERILVKTPKTQAIIGKGRIGSSTSSTISLPAATLELKTDFVSLIFTPLDDLPLEQSKQILLTALARDKQTGATYSPDGSKLLTTGTAPLLLEPVQAKILLKGDKPKTVRPLDHYGVPMEKKVTVSGDGSFAIHGEFQAYYFEILR